MGPMPSHRTSTSNYWQLRVTSKVQVLTEIKCWQTKNTVRTNTKQQTQKSHQRAPKAQQKQADSQGQPSQVMRSPKTSQTAATASAETTEILSIHINDMQTSTYNADVGDTKVKTLFDSGATLSCISKWCYERICTKEPDQIIDDNTWPSMIMSASNDELTNLRRCRLRFKFEYYFQIIKNLKWDLILGLNFQKTFKILQDVTDTEDLYLHIRNKIVTFSIQSTNRKKLHLHTGMRAD